MPQDHEEALKWYSLAVEQGEPLNLRFPLFHFSSFDDSIR